MRSRQAPGRPAADAKALAQLAAAGFERAADIAFIRPKSYDDATSVTPLSETSFDRHFLAEVECLKAYTRRHGPVTRLICSVADESGQMNIVFMHANPGIRRLLQPGARVRVLGKLHRPKGELTLTPARREMVQPRLRSVEQELPKHLTPVYPQVRQIPPATLARLIRTAVSKVLAGGDTLPKQLRERCGTVELKRALHLLHWPLPGELELVQQQALPTLKCDEWLAHLLLQCHQYLQLRRREARALACAAADIDAFAAKLPFKLTGDQRAAMLELVGDLGKPEAMRRLLHGDVGCGKTLVGAFGCWLAGRQGLRSVIMCPTVILAAQHYGRLKPLFESLQLPCTLLISSQRPKERREALATLAANDHCVAIGTHTLFQRSTNLPNLALAVIDEQHRFGVAQRKALERKGGGAHVLMMSATPIPRSLELGLLSHLDITRMRERPHRRTIRTLVFSSDRANEILAQIIANDLQTYWICPLIARSAKLDLRAAEDEYRRIRRLAPQLSAQLIHGKLDNASKLGAMRSFEDGSTRLLVATTVVEVGVDAPEADAIVIDHAERLGLSQLHQLRGRVGRASKTGFCALLYDPGLSATALERLRAMHSTEDGFEIARRDLMLRGPGDIIGKRQSGIPKYKFAALDDDLQMLQNAKSLAQLMLAKHKKVAADHVGVWLGPGGSKRLQRSGRNSSRPPD